MWQGAEGVKIFKNLTDVIYVSSPKGGGESDREGGKIDAEFLSRGPINAAQTRRG